MSATDDTGGGGDGANTLSSQPLSGDGCLDDDNGEMTNVGEREVARET